jgi:hypothetical protein
MVLIHYNVIDILIVPLNASTVYHILEMFVVGVVFLYLLLARCFLFVGCFICRLIQGWLYRSVVISLSQQQF